MKGRLPVLLVALVAIAVMGFVFLHQVEEGPPEAVAATLAVPEVSLPAVAPPSPATSAAPVTGTDVERWIAEATGADAGKRATAIVALAQAPVAQAQPVLRRVLMSGEPVVDRPLALQSLRDLALSHGDPNSVIRNTIREAIYHGDDQTKAGDAQEALDVIEESL